MASTGYAKSGDEVFTASSTQPSTNVSYSSDTLAFFLETDANGDPVDVSFSNGNVSIAVGADINTLDVTIGGQTYQLAYDANLGGQWDYTSGSQTVVLDLNSSIYSGSTVMSFLLQDTDQPAISGNNTLHSHNGVIGFDTDPIVLASRSGTGTANYQGRGEFYALFQPDTGSAYTDFADTDVNLNVDFDQTSPVLTGTMTSTYSANDILKVGAILVLDPTNLNGNSFQGSWWTPFPGDLGAQSIDSTWHNTKFYGFYGDALAGTLYGSGTAPNGDKIDFFGIHVSD